MRSAANGMTLLEVAISMALFTIVALGVASMLSSGMDTQMAYRVHEMQHNVSMNIIDQLRQDVLDARTITIFGGGSQMTATTPANVAVTWSISGGLARRNGQVLNQSPFGNIALTVSCGGNGTTSCFEGRDQNGALVTVNPKRVVLNELTVSQQLPPGGGSLFDQQFGAAAYRVNDVTFEMMAGTTFL